MLKFRAGTILKKKKKKALQNNKLSEINKEFRGDLNRTHIWGHFSMPSTE